MNRAKTIKIFLLDGEPTGTKTVELSNWNGKAYIIPRNKLQELDNDSESKQELESQCIYFLIGESEERKQFVYIGEAENFYKRLKQHNRDKDFWNTAICFFVKDENLTKAHIKYLEDKLTRKIKEANRVIVDNSSSPSTTRLPRSDQEEMTEFIENIEKILGSLGHTFTQDIRKRPVEFFICENKKKEVNAAGNLTNEGFVVYPVSKIAKNESPSISPGISKRRKQAIEDGILKETDDFYISTEEMLFSSPSYAAGFVLGRSANGWREWKTKSGTTLDELKRQ